MCSERWINLIEGRTLSSDGSWLETQGLHPFSALDTSYVKFLLQLYTMLVAECLFLEFFYADCNFLQKY